MIGLLGAVALGWGCGGPRGSVVLAVPSPDAPAVAGAEYKLQPGDKLEIKFLYHPEMNTAVPVRPDGRITLQTTGEMKAAGLTPLELQAEICTRSSTHLRDPEVTVIVTEVGEQRAYVGGEVEQPGYVALRSGMTPLQAIVHVGGFTNTAQLDSVMLLSHDDAGAFVASRVDMEQVVREGVPERVVLAPNDVIYVPRSRIGDMNVWVDQYIRGLIPTLPRVGAGYSLSGN